MHYCIKCGEQLSLNFINGNFLCVKCNTCFSSKFLSLSKDLESVDFFGDQVATWTSSVLNGRCSSCESEWKSRLRVQSCPFCGKKLSSLAASPKISSRNVLEAKAAEAKGFIISKDRLTKYIGREEIVEIPEGICCIGKSAFEGCYKIREIILPDSIDTIENSAFWGCSDLRSINLKKVKTIGSFAFFRCTSLEKIDIPDGVTVIEYRTFQECTNLVSVTLPECLTEIGAFAFYGCEKLKEVHLPNRTKAIGNEAFRKCSNLTKIDIPSAVEEIGDRAFTECSNLKKASIPKHIKNAGRLFNQ